MVCHDQLLDSLTSSYFVQDGAQQEAPVGGGGSDDDDDDGPPRVVNPRTRAWVLSGGETLTMPGTHEPDLVMDPTGLLKSLMSPRGNHGSEDNAARSM